MFKNLTKRKFANLLKNLTVKKFSDNEALKLIFDIENKFYRIGEKSFVVENDKKNRFEYKIKIGKKEVLFIKFYNYNEIYFLAD